MRRGRRNQLSERKESSISLVISNFFYNCCTFLQDIRREFQAPPIVGAAKSELRGCQRSRDLKRSTGRRVKRSLSKGLVSHSPPNRGLLVHHICTKFQSPQTLSIRGLILLRIPLLRLVGPRINASTTRTLYSHQNSFT